jgi:hypothetical protein
MPYKILFIFVEGNDDKRFFNKIIEPKLQKKYDCVKMICCAELKKKKIENFIKSIKSMGADYKADYIYVKDINASPCVFEKKQKVKKHLNIIDEDKMIIVIKEIESWYLAGLDIKESKKFKIKNFSFTDDITKEKFNTLINKKFDSRIDFMLEILKVYSIKTAIKKNKSFKYFYKYL